jgi:cytochrome c-type biogenesis protein CcmH/NrfF
MWLGCLLALWVIGLLGFAFLLGLALIWEAPWLTLGLVALVWWRLRRRRQRSRHQEAAS